MSDEETWRRFEAIALPHLDAAYNLARWLTRNDHDADDVLQEAMLRAYRHFDGLRGDARPWLLAVVRNACFTWLQANRPADLGAPADDAAEQPSPAEGPEALVAREPRDFATAIRRLRDDPALAASVIAEGHRARGERHDPPEIARRLLEEYTAVV